MRDRIKEYFRVRAELDADHSMITTEKNHPDIYYKRRIL